jgi:alkanesulfonate monooxygenase SsuD/methylene tetrahydromethanopterin reductase-like flavin-dependent oxidoreductase (luciferase family)
MSAGEMQSRNVSPEDSLAGGKRRVGEPETFEYDYDYTEVPDAEGTSRTRGAPPLHCPSPSEALAMAEEHGQVFCSLNKERPVVVLLLSAFGVVPERMIPF